MEEKIYLLAYKLKNAIENDDRIIYLNKLEEKMNNDEKVMTLSYKKDLAINEYEDALRHFGENSNISNESFKNLLYAKETLYSFPLVKEYIEAYKKVRDLYLEINGILFDDFSLKRG